jgi:hypothetical protein
MQWHGWYRDKPGAVWNRVCQGATLDECAKRLTKATKGKRLRNTDFIMTSGGYPMVEERREP